MASSSGCSWIFVQPLPSTYEPGDFSDCTTNRTAPVVDTLFTITNVASALYVAGEDNVTNKGPAVTAGLLVGALWLSSAIYGYSKTSACEDAKAGDRGWGFRPGYRPPALRLAPPTPTRPTPAPAPRDTPS